LGAALALACRSVADFTPLACSLPEIALPVTVVWVEVTQARCRACRMNWVLKLMVAANVITTDMLP
jgi:hypothetical protein